MKRAVLILGQVLRHGARTLGLYLLWSVWLALAALALTQVYVGLKHEVAVPGFVLRRLEAKLQETGVRVTFERASFDPTGRILVRSPRVYLPGYPDAVASARAMYVGLEPWHLAVGRVEIRDIRLVEGAVNVSAMLSPSGRAEPIVDRIDALVVPHETQVDVKHVSARMGTLNISVHGAVSLGAGPGRSAEQWATLLRAHYVSLCRNAVAIAKRLEGFEQPNVEIALTPVLRRGASAHVEFTAREIEIRGRLAAHLKNVRARTDIALSRANNDESRVDLEIGEVRVPGKGEARQVSASARARIMPDDGGRIEPLDVRVTASSVVTNEGAIESLSVAAQPKSSLEWSGEGVLSAFGSRLQYSGDVDFESGAGRVRLEGSLSPGIFEAINRHARLDVKQFFSFEAAEVRQGLLELAPGWKFRRARAHVTLRGIDAHGVKMDGGSATVFVDPHAFYSPDAFATIGSNYAHGSYEHVWATHEFRFLLDGRLRPLDISGWFQDWWPDFFRRLEFPVSPPPANVEVKGFWGQGRKTIVYVFADANDAVVLGEPLQRVRTRLFIRPGFYDGLELFATHPKSGKAQGTFTVSTVMDTSEWKTVDVNATSTMPFASAARMFGPWAHSILEPFAVTNPPDVQFSGHFDGPAVPGKRHHSVQIEARTTGPFSYHHFPLDDVAFRAQVRDDEITVDSIGARFAGGNLRLHARVWGEAAERRVGFEASVTDASLGAAAAILQNFSAAKKGLPQPPPGKFVQEKANVRIDVAATAEGLYSNPLSYRGSGTATLSGAEIGEVPIFGPLSQLLRFTSMRFTSAKTSFVVNGPKLEFPDFALRGSNSAIDARGEYALDKRELDFRAKVFPFQESGNVIKSVVGAVLTPISSVLEVKLTGTLENPDWAFLYGPTNLLRTLAEGSEGGPVPGAQTQPVAPVSTANPAPSAPTPPTTPRAEPQTK